MEVNDVVKALLVDKEDLGRMLDRMSRQIVERLDPQEGDDAHALVGMQTRGVHLARRLQERIRRFESVDMPLGVLDATMYRDDYRRGRIRPVVKVTDIPFDVTGKHIVLVDDVLYTGRTVRAALDALMDMGRPASVLCLVVIDRGHHELPIQADIVGRVVPTMPGEEVRVRLSEIDDREGVWLVEHRRDEPSE
jgi:pyrimidine operon attenuation protein/uracil phosphoribosyltransferase